MNAPLWIIAPVLVLVIVAAQEDVRTRRIPNHLTLPALLVALASHAALGGLDGFNSSLTGMTIAGGVLLPGWLLGWMGAGDVKLMAAIGAWFGMPGALLALLWSLVSGGVMALGLAIRNGALVRTLQGAAMIGAWGVAGRGRVAPPATSGIRFPFAVAALAGALLASIGTR